MATRKRVRAPGTPPFTRVLVATDFSPGARRALERAAMLPLADRASVAIAHVLPTGMPRSMLGELEERARLGLEEAARTFSDALRAAGRGRVSVEPMLGRGRAYVELTRKARLFAAELVALGRRGEPTVKDMLLGTTAKRVVRLAEVPTLVVARKARSPYARPLVAVDLEDESRAVVDLALRATGPKTKSVVLVHAYRVPFESFVRPTENERTVSTYRKSFEQSAHAELRELVAAVGERGVALRPFAEHGDPRVVVLREAERRDSDLLVVGTHRRSGIARTLLGSVAEWLVESAVHSDVLVGRPGR